MTIQFSNMLSRDVKAGRTTLELLLAIARDAVPNTLVLVALLAGWVYLSVPAYRGDELTGGPAFWTNVILALAAVLLTTRLTIQKTAEEYSRATGMTMLTISIMLFVVLGVPLYQYTANSVFANDPVAIQMQATIMPALAIAAALFAGAIPHLIGSASKTNGSTKSAGGADLAS
jgi:hypothetical protein